MTRSRTADDLVRVRLPLAGSGSLTLKKMFPGGEEAPESFPIRGAGRNPRRPVPR